MKLTLRPTVLAALLAVLAVAAHAAESPAPAPVCSSDTFAIDGSSVAVALCVPAGVASLAKPVVTERLSVHDQPTLERQVPIDRVAGADTSRAIDDVPLAKLGLARTLHLTIALRGGTVRLEHALMIPGAVALK